MMELKPVTNNMLSHENIHCLALNYKGVGADDVGSPLYFVKSKSALCPNKSLVRFPGDIVKLWTEVELGVVIRSSCSDIDQSDIDNYIKGFMVCADLTAENILGRDHHLAFSKSRTGFCPVGDDLVYLKPEIISSLNLYTEINGKITQQGSIKNMKFDPYKSTSYISTLTELWENDLILTGTPPGVENNIIKPGDRVRHIIESIGELSYEII